MTYSADCSPNDELVRFARDTDMLLIEATLPRPERTGERGHLTPREAGEHGRRAGARRIVLTHFSDELDAGAGPGPRRVRRTAARSNSPTRAPPTRSESRPLRSAPNARA